MSPVMMPVRPLSSETPVTLFLKPTFGIAVQGSSLCVSVRSLAPVVGGGSGACGGAESSRR